MKFNFYNVQRVLDYTNPQKIVVISYNISIYVMKTNILCYTLLYLMIIIY